MAVSSSQNTVSSAPVNSIVQDFCRTVTRADGQPTCYIVDPQIEWVQQEAVVECRVLWNLATADGRRSRWNVPERFTLSKDKFGRYVITDAVTTLAVMKYARDPAILATELARIERDTNGLEASR